jgi:diguanylate cyclase (GGDEF)-like protein/PAS domain S-box-containing protein
MKSLMVRGRESADLALVTIIAITFSSISISFHFLEGLYYYIHSYFSIMTARFISNFVFLYLAGLLWATFRRWRGAERKKSELENVVSSISPDVLLVVNAKGGITMCNNGVERMFGYKAEDVLQGKPDLFCRDGETRAMPWRQLYDQVDSKGFHVGFAPGIKKNGDVFPMEIITGRLSGNEGAVLLLRDITDRRKAEDRLNSLNAELDQLFNIAADAIWVLDVDYTILRANDTLVTLFNVSRDTIIGHKCFEVIPCRQHLTPDCSLRRIADTFHRFEYEMEVERNDEKSMPLMVTAAPFRDSEGNTIGVIEDFRDITERKRMEEKLRALSITDELTGLYNKRGFLNMVRQQLKVSRRQQRGLLLFFIDLDHMKWINDTLGHNSGDHALVETAGLLNRTFRTSDILGRIGGDEFAIVAIDASPSGKETIMERLKQNLEELNSTGKRDYALSLSVGAVHYDPDELCTIDEMIARADSAMYEDKRSKKLLRGAFGEKEAG